MWRLNNGFLPETLANNFHRNRRSQLSNSLSRLESFKQYVLFAGPQLWNELPSEITSKSSLNSFSSALKNHLMGKPITSNRNSSRNNSSNPSNRTNPTNHISNLANNRGINLPFVSRWNQWAQFFHQIRFKYNVQYNINISSPGSRCLIKTKNSSKSIA